MKRRVLIATPAYGGLVTDRYTQSLLETQKMLLSEGIEHIIFIIGNESLINRGRNKCAQMALNWKCTDLFFIDADIGWTWKDFSKILKSPQHIVGGTYPMKMIPVNLNYNLLAIDRPVYQRDHIKSPEILKTIMAAKGADEIEVQHIPTGFMRISGTVLNRLKHKVTPYIQQNPRTGQIEQFWEFFPVGVKDNNLLSEDWMFCEICRANHVPIYMNLTVILDHVGSYNYGSTIIRG